MVSLEIKSNYIKTLTATGDDLLPVINFIFYNQSSPSFNTDFNNPHSAITGLINCIQKNAPIEFVKIEDNYLRRNPDYLSPWINNDYLIFLFLIASAKFKKDSGWLNNAILKRKVVGHEQGILSDFYSAAINGNINPKPEIVPLIICYRYFTGMELDQMSVSRCISSLQAISFPPFSNDFLNLMYLKAHDIVLELKDMRGIENEKQLTLFSRTFLRRINLISSILVYLCFGFVLIIVYYLLKYLFVEVTEATRNIILTIVGIVDITILEIFKTKKTLSNFFSRCLRKFFGFQMDDKILDP